MASSNNHNTPSKFHQIYTSSINSFQYYTGKDNSNTDSTHYNTIAYRSLKISKQIILSQLSGAFFTFGFGIAGAEMGTDPDQFKTLMYVGYIIGMSLGTHVFGNDQYEKAPFIYSLIGAIAGSPIGLHFYNSDPIPHGFTAIAPLMFPTVGAVISFNLFAKPR